MTQEYVLGFRFDQALQNVVVIEKQKPAWQKGFFNGIGGKVEEKDKVEGQDFRFNAMIREFEEETGVETDLHSWDLCLNMKGSWGLVYVFRSVGDISEAHTMEMEEIYISDSVKIPTKSLYNLRWIIPLLLDNQVVKPITINYVS